MARIKRTMNKILRSCEKRSNHIDHDVAQLTKLSTTPNKIFRREMLRRSFLRVSPVTMLAGREINLSGKGRFSTADRCHVSSRFLPNAYTPQIINHVNSHAYVSQFSTDGSLFFAAFQDNLIRIYDVEDKWKTKRDIRARNLRWTITDASLSPDNRLLVYSTISPVVHIVNVGSDPEESHANELHRGLYFSTHTHRDPFTIFSAKFSKNGSELVAASNDGSIYIYDLATDGISLRIPAHLSDVNTACFADESANLLYSGGDDNLCKVWDRRCFSSNGKAAGVLEGHIEGITFIDSRGDGRYFISNGKDQLIKLWDIRRMSSKAPGRMDKEFEWDYRWMDYPSDARSWRHPNDLSVTSFKGHSILRTLIRCYFSPASSTAQKYIYTGSSDGRVYIYDLVSRRRVNTLNHHKNTVRDCSWHPDYPTLVSSSWDGDVAKWDFVGYHKSGGPVLAVRPSSRLT